MFYAFWPKVAPKAFVKICSKNGRAQYSKTIITRHLRPEPVHGSKFRLMGLAKPRAPQGSSGFLRVPQHFLPRLLRVPQASSGFLRVPQHFLPRLLRVPQASSGFLRLPQGPQGSSEFPQAST